MPDVRAMAIFQGHTNLPEDRFVNTFHFSTPIGSYSDLANAADGYISDFYLEDNTTESVAHYLSPAINRLWTVQTYNLDDPEPRVPTVFEHLLPAVTAQSGSGIPEECAVCVSYHGAPPVTARRRGRIYIGPLGSDGTQFSPAGPTAYTKVTDQFLQDLGVAAQALVTSSGGSWVIRSTVPVENFVPIVGGWIDNRADTQRRRGPETSVRTLWG